MSVDLQKQSSFFSGPVVKTVLVAGASGGAYVFVSDFFLGRYFKNPDDATGDLVPGEDSPNAEYMRAGAQALGGLALAGLLSRYNKDAAVGVGIGAIVGAARHIAIKQDFEKNLEDAFPETPARTTGGISYMGRASGY